MSWWGKIQRSLNIRDPDALKKTVLRNTGKYSQVARDKAKFLNKQVSQRGTQLSKHTSQLKRSASDYRNQATNRLKRSASDYGSQFKYDPESLRKRSIDWSRHAQKQASERTAEMQRHAVRAARALPSKATEVCEGVWLMTGTIEWMFVLLRAPAVDWGCGTVQSLSVRCWTRMQRVLSWWS